MPTIPTGQMERELRALYLRWLSGVSLDSKNLTEKLNLFERQSTDLIERMGGATARLGALAGFPAPKRLDLSLHIGTIYSDMQTAAIQAGIMAGLNATDVARQMFRAGMDKSFNRLNRLARTETVRAYWKNSWDSIADLPDLVMLWGSEDGPRTCAWCKERDGMVMESSSVRDHPNGRCTPIPTLRHRVEYKGSVRADGTIYMDPAWAKKPSRSYKDYQDLPMGASTPAQLDALSDYESTGYSDINRALREGGKLPASIQKNVDLIDEVMSNSVLDRDALVWRGQDLEDFVKRMNIGVSEEWLAVEFAKSGRPEAFREAFYEMKRGTAPLDALDMRSLVGSSYSDKAYMSTSFKEGGSFAADLFSGMPIQFKVTVPSGSHATRPPVSGGERELILDRGMEFQIISVVWEGSQWVISLMGKARA